MVHAGIVRMYRAAGQPVPRGLGKRISEITTPEQFAALLAEVRPKADGKAGTDERLDRAFFEGLSDAVPGRITLIEARDAKVEAQMAANRYVGIQIVVGMNDDAKLPQVQQTFEGGPAQRAGVKKGDLIEAIDDTPLGGGSLKQYIDRLRGAEGTEVAVRVRREGSEQPLTFRMNREALPHPTISGIAKDHPLKLDGPDPIGYLMIEEILSSTARELRQMEAKMQDEGLKAVVIDLRRHDPSTRGDLHSAVLLADELLDAGPIGRVRLHDRESSYLAEPGAVFAGWPMVVLVGGFTSGESEWLAAALQDNRRATIIGSPTHGIGVSLSTLPVGDGSWSMTLVTGLLERADGRPIGFYEPTPKYARTVTDGRNSIRSEPSRLGITPDIAVPPSQAEPRDATGKDASIGKAIEVLRKAVSSPAANDAPTQPAGR